MKKYFVKVFGHEFEVTKEQFIQAEQVSGFFSKTHGEVATASFSNGVISGRVEYE